MGEIARILRKSWWLPILLLPFEVCLAAPAPQKPSFSGSSLLWAKLQSGFDSSQIMLGDPVMAQVLRDWSVKDCSVASGSSLSGTVVALRPRSASTKSVEVSLAFTARCSDGRSVPVKLIAVLYAQEEERSQMDLATSMPTGIGAGASGRQSTNLGTLPAPGVGAKTELPSSVKVGQVTGIRHVSLSLSPATDQPLVLSSTDQRLRLESGTRLAFLGETDNQ